MNHSLQDWKACELTPDNVQQLLSKGNTVIVGRDTLSMGVVRNDSSVQVSVFTIYGSVLSDVLAQLVLRLEAMVSADVGKVGCAH